MGSRRPYPRPRHCNGIFQICFYKNLFNPSYHSKIQSKTKLNQKTIELLLNKLFDFDYQEQNEKKSEYVDEQNKTVA